MSDINILYNIHLDSLLASAAYQKISKFTKTTVDSFNSHICS
jgi:hypothetical protein